MNNCILSILYGFGCAGVLMSFIMMSANDDKWISRLFLGIICLGFAGIIQKLK